MTREEFFRSWKEAGECIIWTGNVSRNGTRARFMLEGTEYDAARLMWELFVGPIPKKASLLHTCPNRLCSKIEHLELRSALPNAAVVKPYVHPRHKPQLVIGGVLVDPAGIHDITSIALLDQKLTGAGLGPITVTDSTAATPYDGPTGTAHAKPDPSTWDEVAAGIQHAITEQKLDTAQEPAKSISKRSQALMGNRRLLGHVHSPETKAKMRAAQKARWERAKKSEIQSDITYTQ